MKRPLLIAAALCVSCCISMVSGQGCRRVLATEGVGYGRSAANPDDQFRTALAEALADAIGRGRGTFVSAKTDLIEVLRETTSGAAVDVDSSSMLRQEIRQRIAGYVPRYEVRSRRVTNGVLELTVLADVCLDPRIAVALSGAPNAVAAITAGLAHALEGTGWQVVPLEADRPLTERGDYALVAVEVGADFVVSGRVSSEASAGLGGLTSGTVSAAFSLLDVRSFEIIDGANLARSAAASTFRAAELASASAVGTELARRWTARFAERVPKQMVELRFSNVRRAQTVYILRGILEQIVGVTGIVATYDATNKTVLIRLASATDACSLMATIVRDRQLISRAGPCTENQADITIERE